MSSAFFFDGLVLAISHPEKECSNDDGDPNDSNDNTHRNGNLVRTTSAGRRRSLGGGGFCNHDDGLNGLTPRLGNDSGSSIDLRRCGWTRHINGSWGCLRRNVDLNETGRITVLETVAVDGPVICTTAYVKSIGARLKNDGGLTSIGGKTLTRHLTVLGVDLVV